MSSKYNDYKYFYKKFKSINKNMLIDLVKNKNKNIEKNHIKSVINLFLLQLEDDLFKKKSILVSNFLEFNLRRMPAKRGRNYYTGEIVPTKAFNIMKISINSNLNKRLMKYCNPSEYYAQDTEQNKKDTNDK